MLVKYLIYTLRTVNGAQGTAEGVLTALNKQLKKEQFEHTSNINGEDPFTDPIQEPDPFMMSLRRESIQNYKKHQQDPKFVLKSKE